MPRVSLPFLLSPALLIASGLLAAACGSSSSDASPSPRGTDASTSHPDDAGSVSDSGGAIPLPSEDAGAAPPPSPSTSDASALTCPGPSFDASASLGAGIAGRYTSCALFSGGAVWMANGFGSPVTLTIAESDAGVTASYTYADAGAATLDFHATSSTTATLTPALQAVGTQTFGVCDVGAGAPVASTLTVASGAITYDAQTVFLSLLGVNLPTVAPTPPCSVEEGKGTLTILCERGDDAGVAGGEPPAPPTSGAGFVPGTYACSGVTGGTNLVEDDGSGTLILAKTGANLTVTYRDPALSGTLPFVATSDTTASPIATGQTLSLSWSPPMSDGEPETLGVSAASLSMECGTLFLSVAGVLSPADSPLAGTVTCTRQ